MDVRHCYNCGKYKYIVKNGRCNNCIINTEIYFGHDDSNTEILLDKNKLYRNVNVIGNMNTGKTKMVKNIFTQVKNESGLIYFDFLNKIDKNTFDMNFEYITLDNDTVFGLLDMKPHSNTNNLDKLSAFICETIENECDSRFSSEDLTMLNELVLFLLASQNHNNFSDISNGVNDIEARKNIINSSNRNINNKKYLKKFQLYEFDISIMKEMHTLSYELDNTPHDKISFKNIINNNENIIIKFDQNKSPRIIPFLTTLFINEFYMNLKLTNNPEDNKFTIVFDKLGVLKDYLSQLEPLYRHSRHLKLSIINIIEFPNIINKIILHNIETNIIYRLNNSEDKQYIQSFIMNKMSNNYISKLENNKYIFDSGQMTRYNCEIRDI